MKKFFKENVNFLAVCIFEIVFGVLLLINPEAFTSAVIIICGAAVMAAGLYATVRYFKEDAKEASEGQLLMIGLLLLLFGAFCIFRSAWFIETLPILTVIYGVVILALGFCKAQMSIDLFRLKKKFWFLFSLDAILTIASSLVVFLNPFGDGELGKLWIFTGIALLVLAAFDIAIMIVIKHKPKERNVPDRNGGENTPSVPVPAENDGEEPSDAGTGQ